MDRDAIRDDARFALRRLNTIHKNPDGSPALSYEIVEKIANLLGIPIRDVMGNHRPRTKGGLRKDSAKEA